MTIFTETQTWTDSMGRNRSVEPADVRLKRKLMPQGECLVFVGYRNPNGYGQFGVAGKVYLAHRVAWMIANGTAEIPGALLVCHACDNPPCCNPDHLFLGDHRDNAVDMVQKGRARTPVGLRNGRAKLSDEDVLAIRTRADAGDPLKVIAGEFGLDSSYVWRIANRVRRDKVA